MDLPGLLLAALLCAEVAAVGLAWRRWNDRSWTPLVALLTFALADELAQLCLHAALDAEDEAKRPALAVRPWRRVTIWQVGTRPQADGSPVDWDRYEGTREELERELAVGLTHGDG